jgi:hypothetical protein
MYTCYGRYGAAYHMVALSCLNDELPCVWVELSLLPKNPTEAKLQATSTRGESTEPTEGVMKHTYKLYYTIIAWCNTTVSCPINLCTEKGAVVAQEYNESWLVTSVISADTCDCVHPWSAPWWTHSSPCALNYIFYQLVEANLLHWRWQLPNWGGHLFSLFINR